MSTTTAQSGRAPRRRAPAARRVRPGAATSPPITARYLNLVRRYPLRPIRTPEEYQGAAAVLDSLVLRDDLTPDEADYLAVLTTLVEEFDRSCNPFPDNGATPLQRLKALMRESGTTPAQLGDIIGSRPAASMILAGNREPSKAQIRMLAAYFKLGAGYFL